MTKANAKPAIQNLKSANNCFLPVGFKTSRRVAKVKPGESVVTRKGSKKDKKISKLVSHFVYHSRRLIAANPASSKGDAPKALLAMDQQKTAIMGLAIMFGFDFSKVQTVLAERIKGRDAGIYRDHIYTQADVQRFRHQFRMK